jgi:aryl-alcohol dehydrogenase-like predicted oxidoreductase
MGPHQVLRHIRQAESGERALSIWKVPLKTSWPSTRTLSSRRALAWPLARKPWIVPIPGTRKLARLHENIGAAAIELTSDDLRDIESTASKITVQGARYPEKLEQMAGR